MPRTPSRKHIQQLEVLYNISRLIVEATDLTSFVEAALEYLQTAFQFRVIGTWLHDEETRTISAAVFRGPHPLPEIWRKPLPVALDAPSLGGQVVHTGKAIFAENPAAYPAGAGLMQAFGLHSGQALLGLPMKIGDNVLGAVIFVLPGISRPLAEEERALQAAVHEIAAGIHRLRIEAQLALRMADLEKMVAARTAALAESEARYRALVDQIPGVVFVKQLDGTNSFVSQKMPEQLGFSVEEAVGAPIQYWAQFVHPDDVERSGQAWMAALANRTPLRVEMRMRHKQTGEWRWLEEQADVVRLGTGEEQFVGITLDVTDRKALEGELEAARARVAEQRERVRRLVELLPNGLLVVRPDGTISLANQSMLDLLATGQGSPVGRSVSELPHDDPLWLSIADLWAEPEPRGRLLTLPEAAGGVAQTLFLNTRKISLAAGESPSTILVAWNVTYLAEIDRVKSRAIADQIHHLNARLTSILAIAGQLADGVRLPDTDFAGIAAQLERQVWEVDRRLKELRAILYLSAVDRPVRTAEFDLAQLLRELVVDQRPVAAERAVELQFRVRATPFHVSADRELLADAVRNLLQNALRFAPPGGRVTLRLAAQRKFFAISVSDTGPGIPTDELGHIFEPFYRVPGSRGEGFGLGLSIVKEIVERHHGQIDVSSTVGSGSTFVLRLPRKPAD